MYPLFFREEIDDCSSDISCDCCQYTCCTEKINYCYEYNCCDEPRPCAPCQSQCRPQKPGCHKLPHNPHNPHKPPKPSHQPLKHRHRHCHEHRKTHSHKHRHSMCCNEQKKTKQCSNKQKKVVSQYYTNGCNYYNYYYYSNY